MIGWYALVRPFKKKIKKLKKRLDKELMRIDERLAVAGFDIERSTYFNDVDSGNYSLALLQSLRALKSLLSDPLKKHFESKYKELFVTYTDSSIMCLRKSKLTDTFEIDIEKRNIILRISDDKRVADLEGVKKLEKLFFSKWETTEADEKNEA